MYNALGRVASHDDRQWVIEQFLPLVKRIAHVLMARLPANVLLDDLVQNGVLGLMDAHEKFESGLGAQFETYASQRIRGAMLDGLRDNDWLPRSLRRELRRVEEAIHRLEHDHGRPPSESELAESLGLSLADYQHLMLEARGQQIVYFDDLVSEGDEGFLDRHFSDEEADPLGFLEDKDIRQKMVQAITDLPEREQLVMALYYDEELNLKEIGEVMGVTESRVCQLHSQAVARIRSRLFGIEPLKRKRQRG